MDDPSLSVTLRDIARASGVSLATVSRALRDDPATARLTRKRVKEVAGKLGYRPDPGFTRLVERRWAGNRRENGLNLAYIYNDAAPEAAVARKMYGVFQDKALERGYVLLAKNLAAFRDASHMSRQLKAQGCAGLLLTNLPAIPYPIEDLLGDFPAVSIGVSAYQPACPLVLHDEFHGICHTWDRLAQQGYKRIGVMLASYANSVSFDLRLGGILCRQQRILPEKNRLPILFLDEGRLDPDALVAWFNRHQPDVVLAHHHLMGDALGKLRLPDGKRVPFATFNLWDAAYRGRVAGYFRDHGAVFQRAMTLLNLMIRSGGTGTAHGKLVELVDGEWIDGESLPAAKHRHPSPPSGHGA